MLIVGSGEEVPIGQIPFTPRAKKVLELSLRESLSLGHNYIGTEHNLLALTSDEATSRLLASLGVDVTDVRDALERQAPPSD